MGFIQGEGGSQGTLFPVVPEDLVPTDHVCRVIDAFVPRLDMRQLGFERSTPAEMGRPGYDPRDLFKVYLHGWCTVERPFAMLKYAIFGHPRLLLGGLAGAQTEISLATMAYNLKTMINARNHQNEGRTRLAKPHSSGSLRLCSPPQQKKTAFRIRSTVLITSRPEFRNSLRNRGFAF